MKTNTEQFKEMVLDNVQDNLDQYLIISEYFEALKDMRFVRWINLGTKYEYEFDIEVNNLEENEYNKLYNFLKYLEKENIIEIFHLYDDARKWGNLWLRGDIHAEIKFIKFYYYDFKLETWNK